MKHEYVNHYVNEYQQNMESLKDRLFMEDSPLFNEKYLAHFIQVGKEVYDRKLTTSRGGNLSIADEDHIWVTRARARLGELTPDDVIMTNWNPYEDDENVTSEMNIHHAIYAGGVELAERKGEKFTSMAIIHVHSPHVIFRSLVSDKIYSVDFESKNAIGEYTPVIDAKGNLHTEAMEKIFRHFVAGGTKAVVIKGHGTFATGKDLDDALQVVTCLEQNAKILDMFEYTGRKYDPSEY
jgi:L-fuculose-phosphate aldolase